MDRQWWVIALDDDLIIRDVVAHAFAKITGCGAEHAVGLARQQHHEGRAVVAHCFTPESALDVLERVSRAARRVVADVRRGGDVRLDRAGVEDWLCALSHVQLTQLPRRGVDVAAEFSKDPFWLLAVGIAHGVQHVLVRVDEPETTRLVHADD
ncbi:MAG: hypothetical protein HOY78_11645 [Saccharothrix sp.]|nr:hypothetical protein [Saccharothrix sp.]